MWTYRRALLIAACILAFFYFFQSSGSSQSSRIYRKAQQISESNLNAHQKQGESKESSTSLKASTSDLSTDLDADTGASEQQVSLTEMLNKPLRKQLEYYFPYEEEEKFPAYIWQTWKYSPSQGEFTEEHRLAEASWSDMHPGFVHEVITDEATLHILRHLYSPVPDVLEAYNAMPLPILKADFFRYLILLARGGIYTDIDTSAIRSALDWVPSDVPRSSYGLVIGIEADPDREDWAKWYSRRIQFCQWTIQAKAGHPVLREIVARITEETLNRKKAKKLSKDDVKGVVDFTGPAVWTDTIMNYFNDPNYFEMGHGEDNITWIQFTGIKEAKKVGDVVVLPITSFSPGVKQMGAGDEDDPMAFVKHTFEGTWKPESERHIGEQDHQ